MEISDVVPINQTYREESTGWMIKMAAAWVDKQVALDLNPIGLSRGEFAILMCLLKKDGLTQAEIGKNIAMPGYATTRNIDKLEILNLLKRHPHESSRRSHRIHLTPQGRKLGPRLISIAENINKNILDALDENDRETFRRLLSQVVKRVTSDTPKR